jgi:hypothetical protein
LGGQDRRFASSSPARITKQKDFGKVAFPILVLLKADILENVSPLAKISIAIQFETDMNLKNDTRCQVEPMSYPSPTGRRRWTPTYHHP